MMRKEMKQLRSEDTVGGMSLRRGKGDKMGLGGVERTEKDKKQQEKNYKNRCFQWMLGLQHLLYVYDRVTEAS